MHLEGSKLDNPDETRKASKLKRDRLSASRKPEL